MRNLSFLFFLPFLLVSLSCGKKKIERTHYYSYPINDSYAGGHTKNNVSASVYMIEKDGYVSFQVSLSGTLDSLSYKLHIHEQDTTQPFKYSGNPVIDFGDLEDGNGVTVKDFSTISFDDFTQNFKGYFVVHDPFNVQNDTTTLLIYGKIGADW